MPAGMGRLPWQDPETHPLAASPNPIGRIGVRLLNPPNPIGWIGVRLLNPPNPIGWIGVRLLRKKILTSKPTRSGLKYKTPHPLGLEDYSLPSGFPSCNYFYYLPLALR
ncbi:MAG: hypothetical protein KBA46_03135 [Candidatus Omnitrophica bacterium]|nr:hypothetical protein [Candidatus Omnitrophota bacterium]